VKSGARRVAVLFLASIAIFADPPFYRSRFDKFRRMTKSYISRKGAALVVTGVVLAIGVGSSTLRGEGHVTSREARQQNPFTENEKNLAAGKTLYSTHCMDCHGPTGKGDGKAAFNLDPRPTDLSSQEIARQSDGTLFWHITRGRKPMPAFERLTTADERWLIVLHVRTLCQQPGDGATRK
jgi:mono/diheme cytochrome c family protein